MAKSIFEYRQEVLLKEWEFAQNQISQFDTIALGIRGWAITVFGGMLAVSATATKPWLIPYAAIPIVLFWLIDALFKSFQHRVIRRSLDIEAYLRSSGFSEDAARQTTFDFETPKLASSFSTTFYDRCRELAIAACYANVILTYLALLIACAISSYLLHP
ncbi:MAG TPA: hypothetical protein VII56_13370 [Rhizomicrobium sp.]